MIASQPHKFSAAGETLYVNICEPKIEKLEVAFGPRQDGIGVPSPTNPRPIYGWSEIKVQFHTGKNLFDKNNVEIGKNIGTDGSITDSANARLTDYIPINGQCVFWAVKSGSARLRVGLYDIGKGWLRRITSEYDGDLDVAIVNDPQVAYVRACLFTSSDDIDTAMLELGTARTTFEPYQGTTATVDLGGTRYGGTVDLVSGTMTVTHAVYSLTGEESGWYTYSVGGENCRHSLPTANVPVSFTGSSQYRIGLSSHFTIGNQFQSMPYGNMIFTDYIQFNDPYGNNWGTYTEFKAWLAAQKTAGTPVQIFGQLATPQIIQLDPQTILALRGQQTVFSPAGDVEISYWAHDDKVNGVPSAYRIVKYIQSTQSAYIATEYIPTVGDAFEVDFSADSISDYNALYSAGTGDRQATVLNGKHGTDRYYYCKHFASGDAAAITTTGTLGTRYKMSVSASGVFTFDGQTATTTPEGELDGTATNLWVFRRRNDTQQFTGKLYGFRITNGTTTKLNLVPCVRKTDNVAGAYDTVTRTFYTSAGSESFTAG